MINFVMESFVNSDRKMTKFRPHPITLTNLPIKEIDKVTITNGITTLCHRT